MGHKAGKHKKDLTHLSEEEIERLTKNTTYSKQQIQDWHQGFLRYVSENEEEKNQHSRLHFLAIVQVANWIKRNS